jgi:uncharacterized phage infection (PIP) family protein YhgE
MTTRKLAPYLLEVSKLVKRITAFVSAVAAMAALTGCSSQPSTADLMRAHADAAQANVDLRTQLASDWDRGSELIRNGEKRVEKGEKQISSAEENLKKGNEQVAQGRNEVTEGQKLIQESEQKFRELFPTLELKTGS